MEIIKIQDAKAWDEFIISHSGQGGEFLQSWAWGNLAAAEGKIVERYAAVVGKTWMAAGLFIRQALYAGYFYYYCPRGPIGKPEGVRFLLDSLAGQDKRLVFIRLEPLNYEIGLFTDLKPVADIQPRQTLLLDLSGQEEDLLTSFSQKTRYNIRLAEKKGVSISIGQAEDFEEFWRLISATSARDHFRIHNKEHYRLLSEVQPDFIKLYFASYKGEKIAAGLFSFFGRRATYIHGASDNRFRNLMAPHLLQWQLISEAKRRACDYYDFYGIEESKWPGVTRFKKGFGGRELIYPGTFDFRVNKVLYFLYGLLRRISRR